MDCEQAFHRMYRYLDGELTVWRRFVITRHLDKCPPCADGFTFEVELFNALNNNVVWMTNNAIGGSLGTVTSILPGRMPRLAFQMKW